MDEELSKKLIENWSEYRNQLSYDQLTLEEKESLMKLFFVEYINGRNLINIIYNFPKMVYKYGSKIMVGKYPEGILFTDLKL